MPNGASLHDRLLDALLNAQKVSDVLLVARLEDARIAYDDTKEIRVFIPDLHLLTEKDNKRYRYGFNCKEQIIGILKALKSFRTGLANDESLTLYQLGDFVDLWRQGSSDATKILEEHYDLYGYLSGPLKTWFLLGNHDLDLADHGGFRVWNRRYYFPLADPRALVVHGDVFDLVERYPNELKSLFVYLFGPLRDPTAHDFEDFRRLAKKAHGAKQYKNQIQADCHDVADCVSAANGVPRDAAFNVARVTDPADPSGHRFFPAAYQTVRQIKADFKLNLTTVIIGHSHRARIAVYEGGGEFLALMDCGAWIEQYRTPADPQPKPNAQIGVLVANDCRIYQIE
jgi:UDP-2,3-diacylglucosamine pyrophosphatase LpxH